MAEIWSTDGLKVETDDQSGVGAENLADNSQPLGAYTSRVDDKGRLKLPADIDRHLRTIAAEGLFITSFDGQYARIYVKSAWVRQEKILGRPDPDAPTGRRLLLTAKRYGSDASIDNQGRVLIPPMLRKRMGVENQPVWLTWIGEHIAVMSEEEFDRQTLGDDESAEAVRIYETKGLS